MEQKLAEDHKRIPGALVLEGGSMRCLFTAGVLDVFLEQEMNFSYVIGVSAGSMTAMNYISRQPGRTRDVTLGFVNDSRYLSFRRMLRKRQIFNFDFLFGELSHELIPFDRETFEKSPQRFVAVATRCRTGLPEYFEKGICSDIEAAVAASSSMPILSRMVTIDHRQYLDGGLSMPIPFKQAMKEGYEKVVLVLSRNHGYRKPPISRLHQKIYRRYFGPLPQLLSSIEEIPDRYNRLEDEIEQLEDEGKIFVIRPPKPVTVSRLERNRKNLEALYQEGREEGEKRLEAMRAYLGLN